MSVKNKLYDIAIIGAGPAGMTAAIYAARADRSVAIIDKDGFGGQMAKSPLIENYPGAAPTSGVDLAAAMFEQMISFDGVDHLIDEAVLVKCANRLFKICLAGGDTICAKSVIFAVGCALRELPVKFANTHYCVTCDGPFYKGKSVMVVGSGNTGATYALELAGYCKKVYICDIAMDMLCERALADRIKKKKNISFLPNCTVKSATEAEGKLKSVLLTSGADVPVSAVFGAIGTVPQTGIAKGYGRFDGNGYAMAEAVPGAYFAGDCVKSDVKQITTAVASGSFAAIKAIKFTEKA